MRGRPKKNVIPHHRQQEVVESYTKRDVSLENLARQYAVTVYVVKQVLADAGVTLKPRGKPRVRVFDMDAFADKINGLAAPLGE